jgi:hypothetical protein
VHRIFLCHRMEKINEQAGRVLHLGWARPTVGWETDVDGGTFLSDVWEEVYKNTQMW